MKDPGPPGDRGPWWYLAVLAANMPGRLAAMAGWGVVHALSLAFVPAVLGRALDAGVVGADTSALFAWTGVLLALGCVQALADTLRHRVSVRAWLGAAYGTVQLVTRRATATGAALPRKISTGEMVSVGAADVSQVATVLEIFGRGVSAVVTIAAVTSLMLASSVRLGLVVLVGVPLILALAAPLLSPYRRREERYRELNGTLIGQATDIVAGLRVLRGVGGERLFADRYRAASQRVRVSGAEVARAESMLSGAQVLLPGLLLVLVTWLGARAVADGSLSAGQLVAFYGYAVFLVQPLKVIGEVAGETMRGTVASRRIMAVLALEPDVPAAGTARVPGPAPLTDAASGLVLRPGRVTALVASPADTAAITARLGRHAPGDVTYGDVPWGDVADVRDRVLVAVNEDRLFAGPLLPSLAPARPVPAARLDEAIAVAHAADVVASTGADAVVAEAGREFSGGQRQRLRLARALAADPEILVLVDPTSAVDAHTEAAIAAVLGPAREGRTTLVCTTSPLWLTRVDHVVHVTEGSVTAEGTHPDLLAASPSYASLVSRD